MASSPGEFSEFHVSCFTWIISAVLLFARKQNRYDVGSLGRWGMGSLRVGSGSGGQIQTATFGNPSFRGDHGEIT